ncbi:MAG: glycosyltransferase family 2 protein [Saprospiraceae bacterium]
MIQKVQQSDSKNSLFSILLPTWNNLPYLQLCIKSIQKNAHFDHQIIVIINEGKDGTLDWVKSQNFDYVYATKNIGICFGLNAARSLSKAKYICYFNDDMYACPNWDLPLKQEIDEIGHNNFFLSATMIEPTDTGNPCVIVQDYGDNLDNFREDKLLNEYNNFIKKNWQGATWPPNVVHIDLWDLVGGYSVEFSPGMYSDPDFSRKLWEAGVRYFKGISASRVYHFGSKSTGKVRHNKGKKTFLLKWQMSSNEFTKKTLKRGKKIDTQPIINKEIKTTIIQKLKMIWAILMK